MVSQSQIYLNHNFFNPDNQTQHSAYILGFITADGCLLNNNKELKFCISNKDIEILYYIRKSLSKKFDFPQICFSGAKNNLLGKIKKHGALVSIAFSSQQMFHDLCLYGLIPRKTGREVYPQILKKDLKYHYLRGLLDGDGSIGVYQRAGTRYNIPKTGYDNRLSLYSSNKLFLSELKEYIPLLKNFKIYKIKEKNYFMLSSGNNSTLLNLRSKLYDDSMLFLKRKKDIFFSIPEDKAFKIYGEYKTLKEWSHDNRCVVCYITLWNRITKYHWDYEQALSLPPNPAYKKGGAIPLHLSINDQQAIIIKKRKLSGESYSKLAKEYSTTISIIYYIVHKRNI